jgi:hypothetical protein
VAARLGGTRTLRWLAKIYPKDIFADRHAAVLADGMLLVFAIVALFVLAVSFI